MSFELSVEKLVYGGEALGHYQGRPVMVPRALPGERLEVEEVRAAKGVVHGRPLRVLVPSPQRIEPPCPYFGRCGGCQYQHFSPDKQVAAKKEILRETLRRIGKISWHDEITVHASHPWNYRNQARIKVSPRPDGRAELGFFEPESHRLFPVDVCLILSPLLNSALRTLRQDAWCRRIAPCHEIDVMADPFDEQVMLTLRGNLKQLEGEALARDLLASLPGLCSVAVEAERQTRVFGEPAVFCPVGEYRYRVSPGSFFQASRFLLPELVKAVTGKVSGRVALDLFAGVGLFTLPLARQFGEVVGVESHGRASADLQANILSHGLKNVCAVGEKVHDFLRRYARLSPELVVMDPPRTGLGRPTLALVGRLHPGCLHYVSCHPPTLARDLAVLNELGYGLNSIEMFDFFPETFHIECVAKLTRNHPDSS